MKKLYTVRYLPGSRKWFIFSTGILCEHLGGFRGQTEARNRARELNSEYHARCAKKGE
jgi:hypothetical protein